MRIEYCMRNAIDSFYVTIRLTADKDHLQIHLQELQRAISKRKYLHMHDYAFI